MRALALALAGSLALAAAPGLAQTGVSAEPEPTVVYATKTALDFTETRLVGDRDGPTIGRVWGRQHTKFRNLIELRANFRPELARSASRLPAAAP